MSAATSIQWFDASRVLPDADLTVLVHCPAADEPVWLGYYDGDTWRDVTGLAVEHPVKHWADLPEPP